MNLFSFQQVAAVYGAFAVTSAHDPTILGAVNGPESSWRITKSSFVVINNIIFAG